MSSNDEAILAKRKAGGTYRSIARDLQISQGRIAKVLNAQKRTPADIRSQGLIVIQAPRSRVFPGSWSMERIRAARDQQELGRFKEPVALAHAMRSDDALFVSFRNRIAPQGAIDAKLKAHESTRGEAIRNRARRCVTIPRPVVAGINGTMANHGIAIGYIEQTVNDAGTDISFRLTEWPLEHVYWEEGRRMLLTQVDGANPEHIVHGDGRWVIFRKFEVKPWNQEACLTPAALIWAAHADGVRDWAAASNSHGQAKMIGELPEGGSLQEVDGGLTPEASAFIDMLSSVVSGNAPAGVRPAGSKTDFVTNKSNAWQVFSELIINREKGAARVYLGTDAILGSVGGAPGVDISALFGVASTIIQGDFDAIEQALNVGVYDPWTILHYGNTRMSPAISYQMPDTDAAQHSQEAGEAHERLMASIERRRENGLVVDQEAVNVMAELYGVDPAPELVTAEL